jgi:NAD-dependent aldehyde dehydrogenases
MPIFKFKTEDEAIEIANKSEFGLGAVIFTKSIERAKRIAKYIEAGNVAINLQVRSDPKLPFGGVKKSGVGRELSRYGILEFVNIKSVMIKY